MMPPSRPSTESVTRPGSSPVIAAGLILSASLGAGRYAMWLDGQPTLCPLSRWTGSPCPLCGGTRAALYLVSGQPFEAFQRNPAVAISLAIAALVTARHIVRQSTGPTPSS
ncbi:MAG: DUF2752 domain-containing protein [Actinomycetota bacterium]